MAVLCHGERIKFMTAGLGRRNLEKIPVDKYCRMDLGQLEARLDHCLAHKIPVLGVTAVFGTTQVACSNKFLTQIATLFLKIRLSWNYF
jgi:hypothetical protein